MISLEKVIRNARKWQKIVAVRIKIISYSRITGKMSVDDNDPSFVAEKGHWKRFAVPLAYLGNEIFHELFKMSEEVFGISCDRPITLPDYEHACKTCSSSKLCLNSLSLKGKKKKETIRHERARMYNQLYISGQDLDISSLTLISLKMISAKKLIKLARKWQKLAAIRRRRLTLPQNISSLDSNDCGSSSTAEKGNFVVYTTDKKRFVLPLNYLNNEILRELFNLAEEEFGLTSVGPITLPCDATFMEYAITLIQQNVAKDIEKALLITIASNRCPSSLYLHHDVRYHRLSICT
ncbi:hypothetical protein SADUNF_Sadunf04G0129800 [Salix dunnii]|uniref:Uncharacterized protein n=1 Tax=Salix dunnii TaxID=1413687 RepID=A0A835KEU6_9ROSI|nr:hypothetical protein SADUNF_Sadunf04G0129800 [Salix dunnii]